MNISKSLQHIFVVDPFEVNDMYYDIISVHCQVTLQDLYDLNHLLHMVIIFSMALNFLWMKENYYSDSNEN
jgi:hypothetical protein